VATGGVDNENCVNKEREDSQLHKISIRHFDRVGVLAHVFKVLAEHQWNVQELENIVFKQREACVANIKFSGDISNLEKAIADIKLNENVIDITI
jgi:D-3-phosphoglycerate dehydrogenase